MTESTPTIDGVYQTECEAWKSDAVNRITELEPDLVLVGSLTPFGYTFGGGDIGSDEVSRAGYVTMLEALAEVSGSVVALRDTPYMEFDVPACISLSAPSSGTCDRPRWAVLDAHADTLWEGAKIAGVDRVDLSDSFCDPTTCFAAAGGVVVYRDRQHLTATYSRSLATPLLAALEATGAPIP